MKAEHKAILSVIEQQLEEYPSLRFGQVLSNLGINQFANMTNPASEKYLLRDIYNDSDEEILKRMGDFMGE